jgi:hypothetical protein
MTITRITQQVSDATQFWRILPVIRTATPYFCRAIMSFSGELVILKSKAYPTEETAADSASSSAGKTIGARKDASAYPDVVSSTAQYRKKRYGISSLSGVVMERTRGVTMADFRPSTVISAAGG